MEIEVTILLMVLTIALSLINLLFGGTVFSLLSLVRPGKMKRVQFGCIYSMFSVAVGYGSARLSVYWAAQATEALPEEGRVLILSGMGFVGVLLGIIVGLVVTFIGGYIIFGLSRAKKPTWYEQMTQKAAE